MDIKTIRADLGLTQAELADRLGVDQSTISKMETGKLEVDRRTQLALTALKAAPPSPDAEAA